MTPAEQKAFDSMREALEKLLRQHNSLLADCDKLGGDAVTQARDALSAAKEVSEVGINGLTEVETIVNAAFGGADPLYQQAVTLVREHNRASISLVQRVLRIGYNRAAYMVEAMNKDGIIYPVPHGGYLVSPVVERKKPDDTEGGAL